MSRRLLQLVMPVTPERRMFRIHDPSVDPDAPGSPLPPVGALISTNREQLWVGSLQEDIDRPAGPRRVGRGPAAVSATPGTKKPRASSTCAGS